MKSRIYCFLGSILIIVGFVWNVCGLDPFQPAIASKILRFHVLANSDSIEDQSLKLEVRNAVGAYLGPMLLSADSLEESKEVILAHKAEIVRIAEDTLRKNGCEYAVGASVKTIEFPQKTYGEFTFPKGEYEALQIVIGEGEGQNWWCVLYPNMCFRGSVYEVDEASKQLLREVLSPWEYADVFDSGKIEIRSKFLEYFRD